MTGVPAADSRWPPACTPPGRTPGSTTGPASPSMQGSTMVMGMANLANVNRETSAATASASTRCAGRTTLDKGPRHGLFPHELPGYLHGLTGGPGHLRRTGGVVRSSPSQGCGTPSVRRRPSPARTGGCSCRARTWPSPDRNQAHVKAALAALDLLVVQDLLNETGVRAHVLPAQARPSWRRTHLHQRRAPDHRRRPVTASRCGSRSGRSPASPPPRWATRWATPTARRSWTRSPPPR